MERLPLGVSSNFRYWGDDKTIYVAKGRGARIWDIDGNVYIDYRLGYGPIILGYCDSRVDAAARKAQEEIGPVFALATEGEWRLAERFCALVPNAELVRFSVTGTEAVETAIRLARAYTGKDGYVTVEGSYHGQSDLTLWYAGLKNWSGRGDPDIYPLSEGIPARLREMFWQVPLNDANRLEDLLKREGQRIAAFLLEPILGNCCSIAAERQYLQDVRRLCDSYGVVLIFDEVKTGFRVAKGGAQELYGVRADLATFAKAMGNGYPIAAIAGRAEIMRKLGKGVAHGGTYAGHAMCLAAAEKTLEILSETTALADIAEYGLELREEIGALLRTRGIAHCFSGPPALQGLFFRETLPRNYRDWKQSDYTLYDTLAAELIERGVLVEPDSREPWFACEAHDETCLEETLERFEDALDAALEKLAPQRTPAAAPSEHHPSL
ncbi:MAG TPA: aspartate aminotransferase family protein [Alphaproteobacteria bacterium]|nr:aspartate aminotransferase family protein [Alphaproteobacteria bacterium]